MPTSSAELSQNDNVIDGTKNKIVTEDTGEAAASNVREVTNVPENAQEQESELPSHSKEELDVDRKSENLENSDGNLKVDTPGKLNTVELHSSTKENKDDDTEFENESKESEIPSVVENQIVDERQTVNLSIKTNDTKEAEPAAVHEIPEESYRMAITTTENSKLCAPEETAATVKEVSNATSLTAADEKVKASQMYPKLDSVAKEAGSL